MTNLTKGAEVVVDLKAGPMKGTVDNFSKGWYTVTTDDGTQRKVRASKVTAVGAEDAPASTETPDTPPAPVAPRRRPVSKKEPKSKAAKPKAPAKNAAKPKTKPAKAKPAPQIGDRKGDIIKSDIRDGYQKFKPEGKKVRLDCGDEIAVALRGVSTEDFVPLASKLLDTSPKAIMDKYGHLNPGQIRMTLGVKIRGAKISKTAIGKARKALAA